MELGFCRILGMFFEPSVALYHEFVQGRTDPVRAYLIAGPTPDGYCLGVYDISVLLPFKAVTFEILFPDTWFVSTHPFDCLCFYSMRDPKLLLAKAETRHVIAGSSFRFKDLDPSKEACYEKDLNRLLSI